MYVFRHLDSHVFQNWPQSYYLIIVVFWPYHMDFISRILVIGASLYTYTYIYGHVPSKGVR